MTSEYCPRNCQYLNITEDQQQSLKENLSEEFRIHVCLKYNARLWHLLAHPDLYRCTECYKDAERVCNNE